MLIKNLKKIKKKFNNFLNYDLDWKIIKLSKILKININPKLYKKNFLFTYINNLYLILYCKFHPSNNFFLKKEFEYLRSIETNKNLLLIHIRSGSTYLRNLIICYYNLYLGKNLNEINYLKSEDKFYFEKTPFITSNLWSFIEDCNHKYKKNFIITKDKRDKLKNIFYSRYPLGRFDNLIQVEKNAKILILLRNPKDVILSDLKLKILTSRLKLFENSEEKLIESIHSNLIFTYKKYEQLKKKNKTLVITYEQLISDKKNILIKILKYFNYEIQEDLIDKSINLNKKENYLKYLKKDTTRVQTIFESEYEKKLKLLVEKYISKSELPKFYNELKNN